MAQAPDPNPYELLAWIAGAVGTAITLIQLGFSAARDRRTRRQEQARFGYQLLDDFFDDAAAEVLRKLDSGTSNKGVEDEDSRFVEAFGRAFGSGRRTKDQDAIEVRLAFDRVLYYFDRMQQAIDGGLTRLEDLETPLLWYVHLLAPYSVGIEAYAAAVHYYRAPRLLKSLSARVDATLAGG